MATMTASVDVGDEIAVEVCGVDDGRLFAIVRFGASSIHMPAFDGPCAVATEKLGLACLRAAAEMRARAKPSPVTTDAPITADLTTV